MQRPPHISKLTIENYRALRDLKVDGLRSLTVLIGPNGSGKSTFFDVFAFLSECFTTSLRSACDRRGGLREIRSRGSSGPVAFEISYRENPKSRLLTYRLELDEGDPGRPVIVKEFLRWTVAPGSGRPKRILDFERGKGKVYDEQSSASTDHVLTDSDVLAVNALGAFREHPRVEALRRFISGWYLSYLSADAGRGLPLAGPQPRLSRTGDNLINVLQYLKERYPDRLEVIRDALQQSIPRLRDVDFERTTDGRLVLWLRDAPFDEPVLARHASDGTLKMLSYFTLLNDPAPPPFIGIEEPENHLYWSLLPGLAEACRTASRVSQLLVTTHSHEFVNACKPEEVLALVRDESGYARARWARDDPKLLDQVDSGGQLGWLWQEGYFEDLPEPQTPTSLAS
jgi:predicted ATPase